MQRKRVVVTGYGAVSPFGFGAETLWSSLLASKNGITKIPDLDLQGDIVQIAGCLPGFDDHLLKPTFYGKLPSRDSEKCFLAAVQEALEQSGLLNDGKTDRNRILLAIADRKPSLIHYLDRLAPFLKIACNSDNFDRKLYELLEHTNFVPEDTDDESINHYVARAYQIAGPQLSIATACASSNNAIGEAYLKIAQGIIETAIAGGAYNFDFNAMAGFSRLGALTQNPDQDTASRPFDQDRNGFVMGSGCGILILEEYESARNRGVNILAEIAGYASFNDAYRATDSDPSAESAARAIKACLAQAGVSVYEVQYINAHGTSTVMNDLMETRAIKKVFGEQAYNIPVSSTKSMIGHSIMAAAAIEAIVCIKSLQANMIHPTRNCCSTEPEMDLDYVRGKSREIALRHVLSNSFGFGGQNTSVLFRRFDNK